MHAKGLCYTVYVKVGYKHAWGRGHTCATGGGMQSVCCDFYLADREWWLTTQAPKETRKWVMLTLLLLIGVSLWLHKASIHLMFSPRRLLMLDESTAVVDHHVCVKPLPTCVYHAPHLHSFSSWLLFKYHNNGPVVLNAVNEHPRCFCTLT